METLPSVPTVQVEQLVITDTSDLVDIVTRARDMLMRGIVPVIKVLVSSTSHRGLDRSSITRLRQLLPGIPISLDPADASYSPYRIRTLATIGRIIGPPAQVLLRWDLVGTHVIRALQPYVSVGVWNDPRIAAPDDPEREAASLRQLGVTGSIKLLRRASSRRSS